LNASAPCSWCRGSYSHLLGPKATSNSVSDPSSGAPCVFSLSQECAVRDCHAKGSRLHKDWMLGVEVVRNGSGKGSVDRHGSGIICTRCYNCAPMAAARMGTPPPKPPPPPAARERAAPTTWRALQRQLCHPRCCRVGAAAPCAAREGGAQLAPTPPCSSSRAPPLRPAPQPRRAELLTRAPPLPARSPRASFDATRAPCANRLALRVDSPIREHSLSPRRHKHSKFQARKYLF
jgi:hypothetical protein